jgi:ABC-type uncharacterized transport system permease subunit
MYLYTYIIYTGSVTFAGLSTDIWIIQVYVYIYITYEDIHIYVYEYLYKLIQINTSLGSVTFVGLSTDIWIIQVDSTLDIAANANLFSLTLIP